MPLAPPAQIDLAPALLVPVYTTAILVIGILIALAIALRNTDSKDRAGVIRALAELFHWFRRGGPPGGVA